jgi:hypothetical protein
MEFTIIGIRKNFHIRRMAEDVGVTVPRVQEDWEVLLKSEKWNALGTQWWVLGLSEDHSRMCGTGYMRASYGQVSLKPVDEIGPLTHHPRRGYEKVVLDPENLPESFNRFETGEQDTPFFGWSVDGGDDYYPSGAVKVEERKLTSTGRGHEKPLVWVLDGPSNLGKSTLAMLASAGAGLDPELDKKLEVYETDGTEVLDDDLVYSQIIVVGGKYPHTVDDVRAVFARHELDVELVTVTFGGI